MEIENPDQSNLVQQSIFQKIGDVLFKPDKTIVEVGTIRQARLISIIAFLVMGTISLGAIIVSRINGSVMTLAGLAIISAVGYGLSRTRYNIIGGAVIVWSLVVATVVPTSDLSTALFTNLLPGFVIASIVFPFRYLVFFTIFINVGIGILPFFYPSYSTVGVDLAAFVPFSLLTLAATRFRSSVERDRVSEVQKINQDLQKLSDDLDNRVLERTAEIEERSKELEITTKNLERRAHQFESIAQLARTITSAQNLDTLLPSVVQLVSQNFNFYHAGLFLLDESRQYAVLTAANSEGGQRMLTRKHRLGVGISGIVGYVTATGNPRIALDTGSDAVFFDNPDLPETRSEMALPLRVGGIIIGALDVQSTEPNAFSEDDVEVLSILADEISIAIENARLYEETQRVLEEAQSAFGDFTREAWEKLSKTRTLVGYELSGSSVRTINNPTESGGVTLSIPIKMRGQTTIGNININMPGNNPLDSDEIDITQALAERVGVAIETATLLEETQRRAIRESMLGNISAKISATAEIEKLMEIAVTELRGLLGAEEVSVTIGSGEETN